MKIVRTAIPLIGFKANKLIRLFTYHTFDLIKDINVISNEFANPLLVQQIGLHSFNQLLNSVTFYVALECPDEIAENSMQVSIPGFDSISVFLVCLWFIRDNSCTAQYSYTFIKETGVYNFLAGNTLNTTCTCEFIETSFTNDELEKTETIIRKIISLIENKKFDRAIYDNAISNNPGNNVHMGIGNKVDYNTKNRIERAFMFLRAARCANFILMKISLYMNIYECLFTTDANEIVHKMSERVACYCTKNKTKRLKIFKLIKNSYKIRSRYFHGKELEKKDSFDKTPEILRQLDSLTREILTKVIMVDSDIFLQKDLEPWFEKLIFT